MAIWTARPTCLRDSKASKGPLRTLNLSLPGGAELFFARFDPRPDVRGIHPKDFCLNPGRAQNKSPEGYSHSVDSPKTSGYPATG